MGSSYFLRTVCCYTERLVKRLDHLFDCHFFYTKAFSSSAQIRTRLAALVYLLLLVQYFIHIPWHFQDL